MIFFFFILFIINLFFSLSYLFLNDEINIVIFLVIVFWSKIKMAIRLNTFYIKSILFYSVLILVSNTNRLILILSDPCLLICVLILIFSFIVYIGICKEIPIKGILNKHIPVYFLIGSTVRYLVSFMNQIPNIEKLENFLSKSIVETLSTISPDIADNVSTMDLETGFLTFTVGVVMTTYFIKTYRGIIPGNIRDVNPDGYKPASKVDLEVIIQKNKKNPPSNLYDIYRKDLRWGFKDFTNPNTPYPVLLPDALKWTTTVPYGKKTSEPCFFTWLNFNNYDKSYLVVSLDINGVPFIYTKDLKDNVQLRNLDKVTHTRVYPYGTEYLDIPQGNQDVASLAYKQAQQGFIRIKNTNKIIFNTDMVSLSDQAKPDGEFLLHSVKHKFYIKEYDHVVYFPQTKHLLDNIISALYINNYEGPNGVNQTLLLLVNSFANLQNTANYTAVFHFMELLVACLYMNLKHANFTNAEFQQHVDRVKMELLKIISEGEYPVMFKYYMPYVILHHFDFNADILRWEHDQALKFYTYSDTGDVHFKMPNYTDPFMNVINEML